MNPILKRKFRQMMQRTTDERFWDLMNYAHHKAYQLGRKHAREAMECHPDISRRMVQEVDAKANEIRDNWDGLHEVTVDVTDLANLTKP